MGNMRLQSATEYLLTYGWAFLIAAVVIAALYLFVFAPSGITPSSCTFSSGPLCQDLILGSSSSLSKLALLLTNSQPYPIIKPSIVANISGSAPIVGKCVPNVILPGGAIICNATISPAIAQSSLATGTFVFSYTLCPSGNVVQCNSNSRQSFTGSFNTHTSPLLSPITVNVILNAQNSTQIAFANDQDMLTANVKMLGTPLSGATVNFTSNSLNAVITPTQQTTNGNGNAVAYIYSTQPGNVLVTASFANASSNTVISFVQGACVSFSFGSASSASGVITIDGVPYLQSQKSCYAVGTSHSYSFASAVSGGTGIQYIYSSSSGCGTSGQSGTILLNANCTLSATYNTVYFLTLASSPSSGGSTSSTPTCSGSPCNALWYLAGSSTTLGEAANGGYAFSTWTGSGTGSYSGSNTAPMITLNNPISETATFTSTSTSTTTSTTSTTTIPANPTCGGYSGDAIYSGSTTLTCDMVVSNDIIINSGVTLNECGYYIEGNVAVYNSGNIIDSCGGGTGGAGGSAGSTSVGSSGSSGGGGSSRTSAYLSVALSGGAGGAGGGGGGGGDGGVGGTGGQGGNGGGIIEIYAGNFINNGALLANGTNGALGGTYNIAANTGYSSSGGGGGGGEGGNGGTIFIGYVNTLTIGTTSVSGGSSGLGGAPQPQVYGVCAYGAECASGAGGTGGADGGGGGGGGGFAEYQEYNGGWHCNPQVNGYSGGSGGASVCGGGGGAASCSNSNPNANPGSVGCSSSYSSSAGQLITRVWSH